MTCHSNVGMSIKGDISPTPFNKGWTRNPNLFLIAYSWMLLHCRHLFRERIHGTAVPYILRPLRFWKGYYLVGSKDWGATFSIGAGPPPPNSSNSIVIYLHYHWYIFLIWNVCPLCPKIFWRTKIKDASALFISISAQVSVHLIQLTIHIVNSI